MAKRRKAVETIAYGWQKRLAQAHEKLKARVRASVEQSFHVVKNIFRVTRALLRTMRSPTCCSP